MTTEQRTQRLGELIGRVADAFRLEKPHVVGLRLWQIRRRFLSTAPCHESLRKT